MIIRRLAKSFFLLLLSCVLAGSLSSQTTTGRFVGTVHDPSGASINGATVTVTDVDRGTTRTVTTDESGDYLVSSLPPGHYKIRAESQGFKILERTGIVLEVNNDLRIDFTLTPGSIIDTVTVTEAVPLLDVVNNTLGGTLSNEAINELPLNGRDFQNLVTLRPGVQRYPGGGFLSISSNGNRPEDNNFVVDGFDGNDPYYATTIINAEGVQGTPASHLPIDAIQEFNAEENPPAEYGLKPGAIVNVGLKSGTNNYHGTVYYFTRNNAFDARNDFNTRFVGGVPSGGPSPQKPLHFHDFGATIGGAIIKDKLFYFVAYEGLRTVVGNSGVLQTPATVSLGGDATNSIPDAEAALKARGIPLSSLSTSLLSLLPNNPATLDPNNPQNLQLGFPNRNREDNGLVKMDWHPSSKDTITGRYFIGDSIQTEQDIQVLQPFWESQAVTRPQVFGVNWTRVFSSNWANEVKFGYNRFWQTILTLDANKNPTSYGINTGVTTPINFGFPEILISGFTQLGGNYGWPLLTTPNQTYVLGDNLSYNHGRHAWKFGAEWRDGMADNVRDRYGKGRIRFDGGGANAFCPDGLGDCFGGIDPTTGMPFPSTPLEDFLAGAPSVGRLFVGNSHRQISMKSLGAYAQDDWRVTPHLTINAGLRYDLNTVIKDSHDLLGNFDPNLGLLQVGQQISSPYNGDHNNFGPRLGVVWDPFGDGKTVIRAGTSIIYEIPHISIFIGQNGVDNASTSGIGVIPTGAEGVTPGSGKIVAASNDFTNLNWTQTGPIFTATTPNCDPNSGGTPCNILAVNRNLRTPYVTTWSLNIQRQLFSEGSLSVGYVGNKGTKLYSVFDINQVDPNSPAEIACGHCEQAGRPFNAKFPFLGVINYLSNGYESKYDGLQVSYTQRPWHGLSMVVGYTWSHSIDQASLNRGLNPQNSLDPAAEYGSSDLDIRQRFTLSLTYDLPGIKTWGHLLDGWQVNSIVTLQTGLPWSVIDGYVSGDDISLTGECADRWDFFGSPSDFRASSTGPIPYFAADSNPACVARATTPALLTALQTFGCYAKGSSVLIPPAAGTFGTMGRNLFRGPNYHNWDFSIIKSWTLREGLALQLRGEFFNILNHPNFTNPYGVGGQLGNVDPSVPGSFGFAGETPDVAAANPVIGSGGPRAIQIGLKFKF